MNEQRKQRPPTIIVALPNSNIPIQAWTYEWRHERFVIRAAYRMLRRELCQADAREFLLGLLTSIPEKAEYDPQRSFVVVHRLCTGTVVDRIAVQLGYHPGSLWPEEWFS